MYQINKIDCLSKLPNILPFNFLFKKLSDSNIKLVAATDDETHLSNTLTQILKPRVVGTFGHDEVKQFIVKYIAVFNFR